MRTLVSTLRLDVSGVTAETDRHAALSVSIHLLERL